MWSSNEALVHSSTVKSRVQNIFSTLSHNHRSMDGWPRRCRRGQGTMVIVRRVEAALTEVGKTSTSAWLHQREDERKTEKERRLERQTDRDEVLKQESRGQTSKTTLRRPFSRWRISLGSFNALMRPFTTLARGYKMPTCRLKCLTNTFLYVDAF